MKTYVILLRGVTPTGTNQVLMEPLRGALEKAGLRGVRTYIQSGNVIAASALTRPAVEKLVHDVVKQRFGGDIAVLARTASDFASLLARNPFRHVDTSRLYFTLLAGVPDAKLVEAFLAPGYAPDKVKVIEDMAYIHCATRYSDLKINNAYIERKLKITATTRNYNTLSKLVELSSAHHLGRRLLAESADHAAG
jgi:uncharacterized protein (DUF1697 family)